MRNVFLVTVVAAAAAVGCGSGTSSSDAARTGPDTAGETAPAPRDGAAAPDVPADVAADRPADAAADSAPDRPVTADAGAPDAAADAAPDVMRRACPVGDAGPAASDAGFPDAGRGTGQILFLVNKKVDVPGDDAMTMRLEARGFTVTAMQDADATTADATGKALILISASVGSTQIATKFRDVAVPVIVMEAFLLDDMAMTGPTMGTDYDFLDQQTEVYVADPKHPMAAGFACYVRVASAPGQTVWGVPAASADKVATTADDPTHWTIFGYRAGAALVGGTPAPARRVGWLASENLGLSDEAWVLFDAAVDWALGH